MCATFLQDGDMSTPSYSSLRSWILRLGHHKLTRPKDKADDWVWIIDHSVQIGTQKCLVILGVRLSRLQSAGNYTLSHEQVEPLRIVPMSKSNGVIIEAELEETVALTGAPRAVVCDGGSDLQAGARAFCQTHTETAVVYDIHHKTAVELKRILENDAAWGTFASAAAAFKLSVQQTPLAAMAPPAQRSKSRYMNLDPLLAWCRDRLAPARENPAATAATLGVDQQVLDEKLAWVDAYQEHIQRWDELSMKVDMCTALIRCEGYGAGIAEKQIQLWGEAMTDDAAHLQERLLDFIRAQSAQATPGEHLLGCSDVIESVFGRYKNFEGEQSRSGFTGSVLAIAAMVSSTTRSVVQRALEATKVVDVSKWASTHIGATIQGTRRILSRDARLLQKSDPLTPSLANVDHDYVQASQHVVPVKAVVQKEPNNSPRRGDDVMKENLSRTGSVKRIALQCAA